MSPAALARPAQRRRRALAHQCPQCPTLWAMRAVPHPSGRAVLCGHCGYLARAPWAGTWTADRATTEAGLSLPR